MLAVADGGAKNGDFVVLSSLMQQSSGGQEAGRSEAYA